MSEAAPEPVDPRDAQIAKLQAELDAAQQKSVAPAKPSLWSRIATATNATKAAIITGINAVGGVLIAFDVGNLDQAKLGAIGVAVNAVLGVFVGFTYQMSAKRVPDTPAP